MHLHNIDIEYFVFISFRIYASLKTIISFNHKADIREDFIAPLLKILEYAKNTLNDINREWSDFPYEDFSFEERDLLFFELYGSSFDMLCIVTWRILQKFPNLYELLDDHIEHLLELSESEFMKMIPLPKSSPSQWDLPLEKYKDKEVVKLINNFQKFKNTVESKDPKIKKIELNSEPLSTERIFKALLITNKGLEKDKERFNKPFLCLKDGLKFSNKFELNIHKKQNYTLESIKDEEIRRKFEIIDPLLEMGKLTHNVIE